MKKIIFIFLCLFVPSVSCAYIDINSNHIAYNDIIELRNRNVVSGYPDDTFKPDNNITGEELITILLNVASSELTEKLVNWPEDYMKVAYENNLDITSKFITKQNLLDLIKKLKKQDGITFNAISFTNRLRGASSFINERDLINLTDNVTRADVCIVINKLLNMSKTKLPLELLSVNDSDLDIKTIINTVEIAEFDFYDGEYKNIINKIKEGGHPYLDFRKKVAEGNYLLVINFDTINNSMYEVPASYESLKLNFMQKDISVIDSFDINEVNCQILNQPYNGVFVKDTYTTTAFYIINKAPQNMEISRDINTLYSQYTNEYVNVNQLNSAIINF